MRHTIELSLLWNCFPALLLAREGGQVQLRFGAKQSYIVWRSPSCGRVVFVLITPLHGYKVHGERGTSLNSLAPLINGQLVNIPVYRVFPLVRAISLDKVIDLISGYSASDLLLSWLWSSARRRPFHTESPVRFSENRAQSIDVVFFWKMAVSEDIFLLGSYRLKVFMMYHRFTVKSIFQDRKTHSLLLLPSRWIIEGAHARALWGSIQCLNILLEK